MADKGTTGDRLQNDRRSDRLLESVQRLNGVGVWTYDAESGEVWWSEQAKQVQGFDPDARPSLEDVAGNYSRVDSEKVVEFVSTAVNQAQTREVDVSLREGTRWQTVRLRCEPRMKDGTVVGLDGTARDVTEETRREQRIELLRQTTKRLRQSTARQTVADELAETAKNILGLVNTTVRLIDEHRESLVTVAVTEECVERAGERPDYPVKADTPAAQVYRTGEPRLVPDTEYVDDCDRGELVSGVYVPIGDHGVLSAGDIVYDAFDEADLEATSLLGELGAEALSRIGWAQRSRAV